MTTFSGYIPSFRGVADAWLVYATGLKAGVIGFPALPGSFEYREVVNYGQTRGADWNGIKTSNEFTSGYFLEAFGQVSTPINWWAQAGAFIKYSGVCGKTTTDMNTTIASNERENTTPPKIPPYIYDPKSFHNQADVTFQRSSWVFGGTLSTRF